MSGGAQKPAPGHTFQEFAEWLITQGGNAPQKGRQNGAAASIQQCFRNFINVRIYRYYRDLVSFRHRGDPGLLLRCINPSEAALVADKASGAVVRFRLGGLTFPPVVYYKIFLRGSVTDLGSFAPRDYTVGKPTQHYLLQRHNTESLDEARAARVREVTMEVDKSLWYHRFENNGWRPIASKHLHGRDHITSMTSQARKADFHHMSETRRKKAETKRENKRQQWMKRMYHAEVTGEETRIGDVRARSIKEEHEDEAAFEESVNMEAWARALDFDNYFEDWLSLSTSVSNMHTHTYSQLIDEITAQVGNTGMGVSQEEITMP